MVTTKPFIDKMTAAGMNSAVIDTFIGYYEKFLAGDRGMLTHDTISPTSEDHVEKYENLPEADVSLFSTLAVCKLNGGLGTSMGLTKAKSLLPVFPGDSENDDSISFLDITINQLLTIKEKEKVAPKFLLMNSYNTEADTLLAIEKYNLKEYQDIDITFTQNKYPRITKADNTLFQPEDEQKSWNPPGHGDIYTALYGTGILDKLIDSGTKYLFVSNSDNLGATPDSQILTWITNEKIPFLMEVCRRTDMDKKGGHLAQDHQGQLLLREVAQCPAEEIDEFQDINYFSYFNTNSLWINLDVLKERLVKHKYRMDLPLIVNPKVVDGIDVIQLETAMGAAISVFADSKAIEVPRSRFRPVKKTDELMLYWAGVFNLDRDYNVVLNEHLTEVPTIKLDPEYFKTVDQLYARIGKNMPDLRKCSSLNITGNIVFGENVSISGDLIIYGDEHEYVLKDKNLEGMIVCNSSRKVK